MGTFVREINTIKRSEVYFGKSGWCWQNVKRAQAEGKGYYTVGSSAKNLVYRADINCNSVCKVGDLIDDTLSECATCGKQKVLTDSAHCEECTLKYWGFSKDQVTVIDDREAV